MHPLYKGGAMPKLTAEELNALGLKPETLPRHVAIVMDGNGRWAQQRGLPRSFGHRAGTERLREIIRFSSDAGVKALTLYAFSTENWRRPEEEKGVLFSLLIEYFNSEIDELHENNVRITIFGEKDPFPEKVRAALLRAEDKTRGNTGLRLNIALNYGNETTEFTIEKGDSKKVTVNNHKPDVPKKETPGPKTGDENNMVGYIILMIAAAGLVAAIAARKKSNK